MQQRQQQQTSTTNEISNNNNLGDQDLLDNLSNDDEYNIKKEYDPNRKF